MKYQLFIRHTFCAVIIFLQFSCSDKNFTSREDIVTPKPTEKLAKLNGKNLEELQLGYQVFNANCVVCHNVRIPNTVNFPQWHAKIEDMANKAALSNDEEAALQSYLEIFASR